MKLSKTAAEILARIDASPHKSTSVEFGQTRQRRSYGNREASAMAKLLNAGVVERIGQPEGGQAYDFRRGRHATGFSVTLRRKA